MPIRTPPKLAPDWRSWCWWPSVAGLNGVIAIEPPIPKLRIGNVVSMCQRGSHIRTGAATVATQHQRCRAGYEGSAEGGAPSGGVRSPRVSGDYPFTRGRQPDRRRAIVGENRL